MLLWKRSAIEGGYMKITRLFGSKEPKEPKIMVTGDLRSGKRILHFDQFMNKDMKYRIKNNIRPLEWMDKVDIFESWYIPDRESKGWVLIKGNYQSNSTENRFKVEWQYENEIVIGEYMDEQFTVSERIKRKKT